MDNQNTARVGVGLDVEGASWEVGRTAQGVVLYLRQPGDKGHVAVTFTAAEANEVGKLLVYPEFRGRLG